MAPKAKDTRKPAGRKPVAKPGFTKQAPRKKAFNPMKVRQCKCLLCGQTTHDIDRDIPGTRLRWHKFAFSKKKQLDVPQGKECQVCYITRRRYWSENFTDFVELMGNDEQLCSDFAERRTDKAQGGCQFDGVKRQSAKVCIEATRGTFVELYETGACTYLARWCREHGLPCKGSQKTLKERILKAFPDVEVGDGRGDGLCVFEPGKSGGDFQFKRGLAKTKTLKKTEDYSDQEFAEHELEDDGAADEADEEDEDPR